ncbi:MULTISPECIES: class I SAM-dependent methyltransferase [Legionella]|uniref:O-methyltransferase n=1 Tax=Legionella steelei TaxID=947033 RepID=A0A0W0ZCN6_9GAMM|nr:MULTISPECIES: class I SAM-dependent methyltransferase [Legionella]KTD66839.1 O-methyltransferase [Legionella steelei]MBN9226061.1 class I SAM-dependent methyltransferase [Legionella steelei]OJW16605.1 MAG: SAM-dependent methyltransferase [Legionella sp. 39-23]
MKHLSLTPELYEYMLDKSLREHPSLTGLRKVTSTMDLANMQVAPEQAQFMQLLLRLIGAKNVLELGTFTGYSALAMSLVLPDDGKLITCDISSEWTSKAHPFWQEAQQDHKIELRLGRALDSLHALIAEGWEQKFDFIFIDADKTNYVHYYELALKLIQPKGLIAIDNIFWDGKVIDKNETGGQTREIKKLNDLIKNDQRVFISLLPIADGLFLVQPS